MTQVQLALPNGTRRSATGSRSLGYAEGDNIVTDRRLGSGTRESLVVLCKDMIAKGADVIVAGATNIALPAQQTTKTLPARAARLRWAHCGFPSILARFGFGEAMPPSQCVSVRSSWWPKASVHIQGLPFADPKRGSASGFLPLALTVCEGHASSTATGA